MSLLSQASPWNSDNNKNKRISTVRKTQKKKPSLEEQEEDKEDILEEQRRPLSFEEEIKQNDDRGLKVDQLIQNMNSVLEDNAGGTLENFTPLEPPKIQNFGDHEQSTFGRNGEEDIPFPENKLQLQPPKIQQDPSNYGPNVPDLGVSNNPTYSRPFSNYLKVYEPSKLQVPSNNYTNMQSYLEAPMDNKLLEKINYMIHMLEQQQNEKTSNITEEFILYLFLGVFIIFVIDSFAKTGKYIR